jgi:hypothetical protein
MNRTIVFCSLVALTFSVSATATAQFDSAVVHIGVDDSGSYGIDNIVNYLLTDSRFDSITNVDVDASGVPTVVQLAAYDSVLIVTDNRVGVITGGGLGTQLGNVLDDYVMGGGRVVFSTFSGNSDIGVEGDILTLAPHVPTGGNASAGTLDMGTAVTSHFAFQGVSSFESEYASTITLSGAGVLLASYQSGTPGVLTVADDSVMFVNGFPADMADHMNGSDFGLVFANALAPIPEPTTLLLALAVLLQSVSHRRRRSV